jgi:hypothetical protein
MRRSGSVGNTAKKDQIRSDIWRETNAVTITSCFLFWPQLRGKKTTKDLKYGNKKPCACPNVPISSRSDRRFSVSYHREMGLCGQGENRKYEMLTSVGFEMERNRARGR